MNLGDCSIIWFNSMYLLQLKLAQIIYDTDHSMTIHDLYIIKFSKNTHNSLTKIKNIFSKKFKQNIYFLLIPKCSYLKEKLIT